MNDVIWTKAYIVTVFKAVEVGIHTLAHLTAHGEHSLLHDVPEESTYISNVQHMLDMYVLSRRALSYMLSLVLSRRAVSELTARRVSNSAG